MAFPTFFRIFAVMVVLTCVVGERTPYGYYGLYVNGRYATYTDEDIAAEKNNTEMKISPSYQFCGPGTKTYTRIARGERGINDLDKACLTHDLDYQGSTEYGRYVADKDLLMKADWIMKSSNYSFVMRVQAYMVKAAMVGKVLANKYFDAYDFNYGK